MLSRSSARAGSVFRRPLLGAPLLCAPATHRSLSLWPSAPTTPPPAIAEASAPIPPTWTELTAPLTLPAPTFFEPASTLLLAVPPALGLSYVAFIPLMTLLIRGGSTLPLTLWQRARTQRYQEVVLPAVKKEQARVALETRNECRREGKSYEEYQKVFAKRVRSVARVRRSHTR